MTVGTNLFSSWREECLDDWERNWAKLEPYSDVDCVDWRVVDGTEERGFVLVALDSWLTELGPNRSVRTGRFSRGSAIRSDNVVA